LENTITQFSRSQNPPVFIPPNPFLQAEEFSQGFAKSFPQKNSFAKTSSVLKPCPPARFIEGRIPQKYFHPFRIKIDRVQNQNCKKSFSAR